MLAFLPSTVRIIGAEACGKRGNPSKTRKTAMATGHASLTSTLLAGAALLLASAGANAQTSGYTFTTINDPLGTGTWGTQAYGINDAGQVVGAYEDSSNVFHGFLDINGNYTTIDAPGASRTSVNGINDAGQMTVEASTGSFIDTNGTLTAVNVPGTKSVLTSINGINSAGVAAGTAYTTSAIGFVAAGGATTTLWDPAAGGIISWQDGFTDAYGINDSGQVAGSFRNDGAPLYGHDRGFIEAYGAFTTVYDPGSVVTDVYGINNAGAVVGSAQISGLTESFRYFGGVYTDISPPNSDYSYAYGINNFGQIVGYGDVNGTMVGYLATPDGFVGPAPLPPIGGTLPGVLVLFGWLGRRFARELKA